LAHEPTAPDDPPECDSCHFVGPVKGYETFAPGPMKGQTKHLCALCASTLAGNALEYPDQYPHRDVLRTICYVGNVLLAAIQERNH
jgi:hypothetical protein